MKAAIYLRVGNPEQLEGQRQEEIPKRKILGIQKMELDMFADKGISGLQTARLSLQRLMQKAGT